MILLCVPKEAWFFKAIWDVTPSFLWLKRRLYSCLVDVLLWAHKHSCCCPLHLVMPFTSHLQKLLYKTNNPQKKKKKKNEGFKGINWLELKLEVSIKICSRMRCLKMKTLKFRSLRMNEFMFESVCEWNLFAYEKVKSKLLFYSFRFREGRIKKILLIGAFSKPLGKAWKKRLEWYDPSVTSKWNGRSRSSWSVKIRC